MKAVLHAALILIAGALAGVAVHAARPGGLSLASFAPPTQCSGAEGQAPPAEMAPPDAAGLCGQPNVVFADTRPALAFAEGHVAGAVHLPCDAAGQAAVEALAHFERAHIIVVYGLGTDDARPVAASLQRRHPGARVAVLAGGFPAWSGAGLACASGPCGECKEAAKNP
jgi:rhodanese-related sulfurtransferase